MTLGERIAKCRKDSNLSQEYVAERLDVSRQAVSKWENDVNAPDTYNLIALAELFNVSVEYLACGKESSAGNEEKTAASTQKPATRDEPKKPKSCLVIGLGFCLLSFGVLCFILNIVFSIMGDQDLSLWSLIINSVEVYFGAKMMDLI